MARGSMSTPFVARAPQVDQLRSALRRADAGEPTAVLSARTPAFGKTRFLAPRRGARGRLRRDCGDGVHCVDLGEVGLPYLPFAGAARRVTCGGTSRWRTVLRARPALARLLPGAAEPSAPPSRTAAATACKLLDGLGGPPWLPPAPRGQALLLVVEDVPLGRLIETRDVLRYLAARAAQRGRGRA